MNKNFFSFLFGFIFMISAFNCRAQINPGEINPEKLKNIMEGGAKSILPDFLKNFINGLEGIGGKSVDSLINNTNIGDSIKNPGKISGDWSNKPQVWLENIGQKIKGIIGFDIFEALTKLGEIISNIILKIILFVKDLIF